MTLLRSRKHPRSQLAQKLLTAILPLPAVEDLADVSAKLFRRDTSPSAGDFEAQSPNVGGGYDGSSELGAADGRFSGLGGDEDQQTPFGMHEHQNAPPANISSFGENSKALPQGSFVATTLIHTGALSSLNLSSPAMKSRLGGPSGAGTTSNRLQSSRRSGSTGGSSVAGSRRAPSIGGGAETALLGSEVASALRRPGTAAYVRPQQGMVLPEGSSLKPKQLRTPTTAETIEALHARMSAEQEAAESGDEPPPMTEAMLKSVGISPAPARIRECIPRPMTVLSASLPDLVQLMQLKEMKAEAEALEENGGGYQRIDDGDDKEGMQSAVAPVDPKHVARKINEITKRLTKPSPLAVSGRGRIVMVWWSLQNV